MKKRILTLSLLMSCCFILFLCSAKNSQAEAYVPDVNWDSYDDGYDNVPAYLMDKNYFVIINISLSKESDNFGACICEAYVPGKELIVPDSVEYKVNGKTYPVTQFIANDERHGGLMPYQTVVLPDSVKKIQLNCNWSNVTKINLPKSMESLLIEQDGPNNVQFVVPDSMDHYTFKNNALYSKKNPGTLVYPLNIPEKYTIAEGTTTLDMTCFARNNVWRYVKEITCPASLVQVKNVAFKNCLELEMVNMEKSKVKVLKPGAFCDTPKLRKVLLPKTLKKMENNVFDKSGISSLSIPSEVSVIGDRTFNSCKKLKKVTFEGEKKIPAFVGTEVFRNTRSGIKFYVKNKKMAKQLKKRLKSSKVKKAKIYAGKKKKLIYKNING